MARGSNMPDGFCEEKADNTETMTTKQGSDTAILIEKQSSDQERSNPPELSSLGWKGAGIPFRTKGAGKRWQSPA
jgi:hypothetical protein